MGLIKPPPNFIEDVHSALKLWRKDASEGGPLQHMTLVRKQAENYNTRRATNEVLLAGLEALALDFEEDASLLRARFLDGKMATQVANERNLAEITVFKMQRRAIERLAGVLFEAEKQANAETQSALSARLPSPTYDQLFGVADSMTALRHPLLTEGAPWLVSIEGLGGTGKTTLAHHLLTDIVTNERFFADFGWVSAQQRFLSLDGEIKETGKPALTEQSLIAALVTQLISGTTSVAPIEPERAFAAIQARLKKTPHLIVVDNLETIVDAENLAPALLRLSNPSKFLLTSRETFRGPSGTFHYTVPELSQDDSLALIRNEARLHGIAHVLEAGDSDLQPIYETVGGNPLALRLVAGQLLTFTLSVALDHLREAKGKPAEELYNFIYWTAWNQLPETARDVFMQMPLFAHTGADFSAIREVCQDVYRMEERELSDALTLLVKKSLVNVSGGLNARRYGIHRVTETFLLKEVIKWSGKRGDEV